ncbi:MAG: archaemetzincin family Zn-dependent metalloprotease [Deltaproteobacteria bacterium]|nr:archaemetzincin family Zn-dependent metalloprotease [Deltaproteobacteria bacterium]
MLLALMLAMSLSSIPSTQAASLQIILIPCGRVSQEMLAFLEGGLRREFGADVGYAERMMVPESAYAAERSQYRADAFIDQAPVMGPGRETLTLMVTDVDLYVPRLNFVFGLADRRRRTAVISLARLNPEFYGRSSNPELFRERALKEAVHELGHLMGLEHCSDPACIMFFSNSLADTDRKGPGFCPRCRQQVGR